MIPKVAHCIFGLQPDFGGKPFSFVHWAAIKSFRKYHPDFTIYFWHHHLPKGDYFNDCVGDVVLSNIEPPEEIFGSELIHFAHRADILRLTALIEHGGVYFDLDSFTVKSVEPLLENRFVMGQQRHFGMLRGLCNAIMMGERGASFALNWMETYRSFRASEDGVYWDEHSVIKPLEIARKHPALITIVPSDYFFNPDWTFLGITKMFRQVNKFPNAFIHHLWESASWILISRLNETNILEIESSYAQLVRIHLAEELDRFACQRLNALHTA